MLKALTDLLDRAFGAQAAPSATERERALRVATALLLRKRKR